jgi:hypothetical protein
MKTMKSQTSNVLANPSLGNLSKITAVFLALLCAAVTARANLLNDPGFENNALIPFNTALSNFSADQGNWGAEQATITLATGNITPTEGTHMLSETNDGGAATQTVQVTNVSAYSALINGAGATVTLSAFFNTNNNTPAAAGAGVVVQFFNGTNYNGVGSNEIGTGIQNSLLLDGDPDSWEQISVSGVIPFGTIWMVSQVLYNDASLAGKTAGYVDAANLTIAPVPEPSTYALLGLGATGLLVHNHRRRQARVA